MSYLDLARKALEKPVGGVAQPADLPRPARRKPWNPTLEEEAAICRVIEKDQGLAPGSLRLYTPDKFRQRFGERLGRKEPNGHRGLAGGC